MWIVIGVLVLAGVLWVKFQNRDGGNSPADWAEDIRSELTDQARELGQRALAAQRDYWKYDENGGD